MRRLCILPAAILIATIVVGCSPRPTTTLSGGKPTGHWVETLRTSPDAKTRKEAAFKLGNVGLADPTVFTALSEALKDKDATVRCEVILALVKFGPAAREVVPKLADLREHDRDTKVRSYAAKAAEKLQANE